MHDLVSIKQDVAALQKIRGGDIDGANAILETDLDSRLIRFSVDLKGPGQPHEPIVNTLQTVKAYRTKYPRTTDHPEIDEAVAKALARADK